MKKVMKTNSVEYDEVILNIEEGYQILVEKDPPVWGAKDPATEKQLLYVASLHQEVGAKFSEVHDLINPLIVDSQLMTKKSASMIIEIYKYLGGR